MSEERPVYPIRTVADLTGVNPVTLRAWERRYGLVQPHRTSKGHRLYTEGDIARIRRILELVDRGAAISRVRELLDADTDSPQGIAEASAPWPTWRERLDSALRRFEPSALEGVLGELLRLYPEARAAHHVLIPALRQRLEADDPGATAEGYLLVAYLRGRFGHLLQRRHRPRQAYRLLLAGPPEAEAEARLAEMALAVLAMAGLAVGHHPLPLGESVPASIIQAAAERSGADIILLHGGAAIGPAWQQSVAQLTQVATKPVAVTGPVAQAAGLLPEHIHALAGEPYEIIAGLPLAPTGKETPP